MEGNAKRGGIGCLTVIGVVFLTLKLLQVEPVAHWSWIWVLCPFWISFAIGIAACLLVFTVAFILHARR